MNLKNVIILTLDGLRHDWIQKLPFLNQLTHKSVFFNKMITYAPYSVASSTALLTGIYGSRNGVDNYYGAKKFDNNIRTIYEILKENNFYIGIVSSQHLAIPKENLVDQYIKFPNDILVEDSIKNIKLGISNALESKKQFFIFINHTDWFNHQYIERAKVSDPLGEEYFKNPEGTAALYNECFKRHDTVTKEIYQWLDDKNIIEETLFIVISDHGASTGEKWGETLYGAYCFDYTTRVFCFLINRNLTNRIISNLIRNVDITPTLLKLLNIECPDIKNMDGKDFIDIIHGKEENRIAYSETGGLGGPTPSAKKPNVHCLTTNEWKLIYNSTTKIKQLYNINKDPKENNNLVIKQPEISKILWNKLQNHIKKQ